MRFTSQINAEILPDGSGAVKPRASGPGTRGTVRIIARGPLTGADTTVGRCHDNVGQQTTPAGHELLVW
jgi:hypothetical protein